MRITSAATFLAAALAASAPVFLTSCATHVGGDSALADKKVTPTVDRAVAEIGDSIVRIEVVEPNYYDGRADKVISFGSGTIITPDGFVMTNHHVAGKAVHLLVTLPNREEVPAVLVGTDPSTDIAIIKLQPAKATEYPSAEFGDSSQVRVGQPVLALGSPAALSQSVTLGIISNTEMVTPEYWGNDAFTLDGENVGQLVRWFGHDAQIYPGNSGGPLVDLDGHIVGVNEIGVGGLGGAIPGNLAKDVAFQIIQKGFVDRAWIGMSLQPLLKSNGERGVLVSNISKDSPAMNGGLEAGDVIVSANGAELVGRFREDMAAINNHFANLPVGKAANFEILRDGKPKSLSISPEQRQPALTPTEVFRPWGITARDVTIWAELALGRQESGGVIVTSVGRGGPAAQAKPRIESQDVIVKVGDAEIRDMKQLVELTETLTAGATDRVPVLVTFERDGRKMVTVVRLGIEDLPAPAREVRKAWLPIETQPLTRDLPAMLGLDKDTKGVRVTRVFDSAGENYAFKVGDVIIAIDGDPLEVSREEDGQVFEQLLRQYRVGTDTAFDVIRDGAEQTVTIALGESPKRSREMDRWRDLNFEFVVREATFADLENPALSGAKFNVIADEVSNGGWANLSGLSGGDAILSIDGEAVNSVGDVESIMKRIENEKPSEVVLFIRRGAQTIYLEMEPSWE